MFIKLIPEFVKNFFVLIRDANLNGCVLNGKVSVLIDRMRSFSCNALKYHYIPARFASSERSFSSAGLTATKLRSRLTGRYVESLNVLHCNKLVR